MFLMIRDIMIIIIKIRMIIIIIRKSDDITHGSNTAGDSKRCQRCAARESIHSDPSNTAWDNYGLKRGTTFKEIRGFQIEVIIIIIIIIIVEVIIIPIFLKVGGRVTDFKAEH